MLSSPCSCVHAELVIQAISEQSRASPEAWHGLSQAIDAVAEVFAVALLPDSKLRAFSEQPLPRPETAAQDKDAQRCLLYWYLEDCIKTRYAGHAHSSHLD